MELSASCDTEFSENFCFSICTPVRIFSITSYAEDQSHLITTILDTFMFTSYGMLLLLVGCIIPIGLPYCYLRRYKTIKLLKMLELDADQILQMEIMNPQSRIYHLQRPHS